MTVITEFFNQDFTDKQKTLDGFWCNHQTFFRIHDLPDMKSPAYPWYNQTIKCDSFCPSDVAFIMKDGAITKIIKIDFV